MGTRYGSHLPIEGWHPETRGVWWVQAAFTPQRRGRARRVDGVQAIRICYSPAYPSSGSGRLVGPQWPSDSPQTAFLGFICGRLFWRPREKLSHWTGRCGLLVSGGGRWEKPGGARGEGGGRREKGGGFRGGSGKWQASYPPQSVELECAGERGGASATKLLGLRGVRIHLFPSPRKPHQAAASLFPRFSFSLKSTPLSTPAF